MTRPYLITCIGLAGLGVWALTGDILGVLALVFMLWLTVSIVGWQVRTR